MDLRNGNGIKRVEAVVFDFDGTLAELRLDFSDMKHRLTILAEKYLGRTLSVPAVPALEGLELLAALVERSNVEDGAKFRREAEELIVQIELDSAKGGGLYPFTKSVLKELDQRQITIAVITRNCEEAVRNVFPDIDNYCATFLARDHVPRVKPDPDHLLRALAKAHAASDGALMVGDHPLDIQTGKRAGTLTAGVWSGNSSREDLLASGADWVARNCEKLISLLNEERLI